MVFLRGGQVRPIDKEPGHVQQVAFAAHATWGAVSEEPIRIAPHQGAAVTRGWLALQRYQHAIQPAKSSSALWGPPPGASVLSLRASCRGRLRSSIAVLLAADQLAAPDGLAASGSELADDPALAVLLGNAHAQRLKPLLTCCHGPNVYQMGVSGCSWVHLTPCLGCTKALKNPGWAWDL